MTIGSSAIRNSSKNSGRRPLYACGGANTPAVHFDSALSINPVEFFMQNHQRRALVLFSGGQDSSTCLAWALSRYAHVETIAFDYGQRHRIELDARLAVRACLRRQFPQWAARLGEDHLLDLSVLGQVSDTALTQDRAIEMQANGLPNTFVPGRNLLFLTLAAALGYRRGLEVLVGGMCETDFSGYPDCRDDTIKAQQVA